MSAFIPSGFEPSSEIRCNKIKLTLSENGEFRVIHVYSGPEDKILKLAKNHFISLDLLTKIHKTYSQIPATLLGFIDDDSAGQSLGLIEKAWDVYTNEQGNNANFYLKFVRIASEGILVFVTGAESTIGTIHDRIYSNVTAIIAASEQKFGYTFETEYQEFKRSIKGYLKNKSSLPVITQSSLDKAVMHFTKLYPEIILKDGQISNNNEIISYYVDEKQVVLSVTNPTSLGEHFIEFLSRELNAILTLE